jgi:GxxExxY protein
VRRFDASQSPETYAIIGAAIEVQRQFGTGLLESAYGDALELELEERGIPFAREVAVPLFYKGTRIRTCYRADFVCHQTVVIELKASVGLGAADQAQMWHYLAATRLKVGLLLNFGLAPMQIRRFAHGLAEPVSVDFADFAAG